MVIEGESIVALGSGDAAVPAGAKVVDLRRYTGWGQCEDGVHPRREQGPRSRLNCSADAR